MVSERRLARFGHRDFGRRTNGGLDGTSGEVDLGRVDNLADARLGTLVEAVNAERIAGLPRGRLLLDSVEQALAVALVNGNAVRHRSVQTYRVGLGSAACAVSKAS